MWSLYLGATSSSLMVFPLLQWTSMPYLLHKFLNASLSPSLYGTVMELLHVGLLPWLLFLLFLGALVFVFILFMAHIGYLYSIKASCICFCSCSNNSWLEHMFLGLCSKELITLYLLDMAWWLSHFRYWLVWVGFLYTFVCRLPSLLGVIKLSKNGIPGVFNCEFDVAVNGVFMVEKLFFVWCFQDDKGIIYISFPKTWGMWSWCSASHTSGHTICHILIISCYSWLFHLLYIGQKHQPMYMCQFPSVTMATTSAMYKMIMTSATNTI